MLPRFHEHGSGAVEAAAGRLAAATSLKYSGMRVVATASTKAELPSS